MLKATQRDWAVKELKENGRVTRNQALERYISRLGAIICDLKKEGWDIEGYWLKSSNGKDFVYKLVDRPTKKVSQITIVDGVAIETFIEKPI